MDELRAKYLFDFAYLLHIPPPGVDALRLLDFFHLIDGIDQFHEAQKKRAAEQNG